MKTENTNCRSAHPSAPVYKKKTYAEALESARFLAETFPDSKLAVTMASGTDEIVVTEHGKGLEYTHVAIFTFPRKAPRLDRMRQETNPNSAFYKFWNPVR